jgi:hypothetical protein
MSKMLNLQRLILAIAAFAVIGIASVTASADTATFSTPTGATNNGLPVNATVTFNVTVPGTLVITLTNLQANPTSVAQNISDLFFKVGTLTGTLTSSSASFINVAANGTVSGAGSGSTGWLLDSSGGNFHLDDLCGGCAGPEHTIIGPAGPGGVYTNANGSIAGNDPHNPFINQTATFTLSIAGLTSAQQQISNVSFSFGTVPGEIVTIPGVPEPTTMLLLGTGLLGVAGVVRRRFRKS